MPVRARYDAVAFNVFPRGHNMEKLIASSQREHVILMAALGQKRTCAVQQAMSALCQ